jgi:hypothetical protein
VNTFWLKVSASCFDDVGLAVLYGWLLKAVDMIGRVNKSSFVLKRRMIDLNV